VTKLKDKQTEHHRISNHSPTNSIKALQLRELHGHGESDIMHKKRFNDDGWTTLRHRVCKIPFQKSTKNKGVPGEPRKRLWV